MYRVFRSPLFLTISLPFFAAADGGEATNYCLHFLIE